MSGELHEGIVEFRPASPGRSRIMLGKMEIGEISPTVQPGSRFPFCYRIGLPGAHSNAWQPAFSDADAQRRALQTINDWMNAAGLRPIGLITPDEVRKSR